VHKLSLSIRNNELRLTVPDIWPTLLSRILIHPRGKGYGDYKGGQCGGGVKGRDEVGRKKRDVPVTGWLN
jgi:hypothetical protein